MTAREAEEQTLDRCTAVAWATEGAEQAAQNGQEANVFRLAAMLVQSSFPTQSGRLMKASERYFSQRPEDKVASADIVRQGWIIGIPRFHDLLCRMWQARTRQFSRSQ